MTESCGGDCLKRKLPNRREGYTQKMKIDGTTFYLRTGEYEDGTLGEIFVDVSRAGSLIRAMMNEFCIVVSKALQNNTPLAELVDKFVFSKFEPSGRVTGHPDIKWATSIVDAIFRDLGINYLGRDDLKHGGQKIVG